MAKPSDLRAAATKALFNAAQTGDLYTLKQAIANGADIEAQDWGGVLPLMHAAARGYKEAAELLLDHGAKVNARGGYGFTALWITANKNMGGGAGSNVCVELLLDRGADPFIKDRDGNDALVYAHPALKAEILAFLAKKEAAEIGADPEIKAGIQTTKKERF